MHHTRFASLPWLWAVVAVVVCAIIAARAEVAASAPLWLDETWSVMIATQPDWASFWREASLDVNPPLYYAFLRGWVSIFGDSNAMLRLPSILFVLAAAALPLLLRPASLSRHAALLWAGLILLWPDGAALMLDARGYGLLLLLSVGSTLACAELLERLTFKRAAAWVALGTLMVLTHYFAAPLVIAQVVMVLRRHGLALTRVWTAGLIALPGIAWFVHHLPRLQDYARSDVAWQQPTTADAALAHAMYVLGAISPTVLGLIMATLAAAWLSRDRNGTPPAIAAMLAATAVIGLGLALLIGVFQASLVSRYLVALVPPALLGVALIISSSTRPYLFGGVMLALFLPAAAAVPQARTAAETRSIYGFEQASDFLAQNRADHVIFMWDHPAAKILDHRSLEQLGSTFLRREGSAIPVSALVVPEDSDANAALRDAARGARPAFIWLYNQAERTAARAYPPSFADDPAWTCQTNKVEFAPGKGLGSIACFKAL